MIAEIVITGIWAAIVLTAMLMGLLILLVAAMIVVLALILQVVRITQALVRMIRDRRDLTTVARRMGVSREALKASRKNRENNPGGPEF